MKLKTNVASSMFIIAALISTGGLAASDIDKATESKPAAAESKKVRPHSHVEEKGGAVSSPAPRNGGRKEAKANPGQDKTRHLHPRDGK